MSKMNVLMMAVLAAATVVADDGKDYRICGLDDGGRLMLVESRKREVRPVVALPVEEAPLATAVFNPGEKLDDFDCEALEHHLGAVRIDAGEGGAASEVYFGGLKFKDFLARERKFRPPAAKCGWNGWGGAASLSNHLQKADDVRSFERFKNIVVRPFVAEGLLGTFLQGEDARRPKAGEFCAVVTNNVLDKLFTPKPGTQSEIQLDQLKYRSWGLRQSYGKMTSPILRMLNVYQNVTIKPELNGPVYEKLDKLAAELDRQPGLEFDKLLLALMQVDAHRHGTQDSAIHSPEATNLVKRLVALAERETERPENLRALFLVVRDLIARPANANTTLYGMTPADRRHLVSSLRAAKVDPWMADVFEGLLELDLAWYGKGDMFSYCPKANWTTKVCPHLLAARELFHRAWTRHPEFPEGAFGVMACEWELYHAKNAARWLGQVWDAELDTPWIYKLIRHRMLTWFKKEAKKFDEAYKAIAAVTKRDLESPYRAAYAQPSVPPSFIAFPLTNEWRQASFDDNDKMPGVTPFKDAGKLQNLRFDPERRAAVWPVMWHKCRMPVDHEGEIDVEFLPAAGSTNRVAFGVMPDGSTLALFSQVTWRDGAYRFCCWRSNVGSDVRCYPYALGEKSYDCLLAPETRRFTLRYRLKDRTIVTWIDGKLQQKLWFTEVKGVWSELPRYYEPTFFGTGIKIHAIRYRQIPLNVGLEEYTP